MSCTNDRRKRSEIINFRATSEEKAEINAKILVTGLPKGEYFIQSCLHQRLEVSGGKFQSDRLSVELGKLRIALEQGEDMEKMTYLLELLAKITVNKDEN
ncbi:MAG: hypothetical protein R3Y63_12510 [Eubacteriales bacterium]